MINRLKRSGKPLNNQSTLPNSTKNSLIHHPKGLSYLIATELWERFAFYIVQGLLVLYVVHRFSWSDSRSYALAGAYTALVYMSPLIGGYLADNIIGQSRALIIGGVILIIGYSLIAMGSQASLLLGLGSVVLGNGFYKPNVSTLVGNLYTKEDNKREGGYTLFFVGFNIGSFLASFTIGYIKNAFGWQLSFLLAATGIAIGLSIFLYGRRYVIDSFDILQISKGTPPKSIPWFRMTTGFLFIIAVATCLLFYSQLSNIAFMLFGLGIAAYFLVLITKHPKEQAQKLCLLLLLMIISVLFWGLYFEEYLAVNLFVDRVVDRNFFNIRLPATFFLSLEPFFVVTVGAYFARLLRTSPSLNIPMLNKFILALVCMALAYGTLTISTFFPMLAGQVHPYNIVLYYLFITLGQLFLYPIGMAAVLKLSPKNMQGFMMGAWFFTLGLGGSLGGLFGNLAKINKDQLSSLTTERLIYQHAFLSYTLIALAGVILILILKPFARYYLGNTMEL